MTEQTNPLEKKKFDPLADNVLEVGKKEYEALSDEYEKISGKPQGSTRLADSDELTAERIESMITDPNLILLDLRKLFEKHNLDFPQTLSLMGFNLNTLRGVLINKTIAEQMYSLNNQLRLLLYKMGLDSGGAKEGYTTHDIRSLLNLEVTPNSKEWLEVLDKHVLPFMVNFAKNGKIDKDWFEANKHDINNEEIQFAETMFDALNTAQEFHEEAVTLEEGTKDLFDEQGNLKGDLEAYDEDELAELEEMQKADEADNKVELVHGDNVVAATTEEALKEQNESTQEN